VGRLVVGLVDMKGREEGGGRREEGR